MGAHARFAPSSAHRWTACPGSLHAESGLPDTAGIEAAEGTVFHDVAAMCLEFDLEPEMFLGRELEADGFRFVFDEEFVESMHAGLDEIREQMASPGASWLIEKRVNISPWTVDGQFGTLDWGCVLPSKRMICVDDWKYGKGVVVSAQNNYQAALYALGFWGDHAHQFFGNKWEGIKVRMRIHQPRVRGGGDEWVISLKELFAIGERIKDAARATVPVNAPRIPGEKQCKFCRAKPRCKEFANFFLDSMSLQFEDLEYDLPPMNVGSLTPEQQGQIVLNRGMFVDFLESVHADVLKRALAGEPTPHVKAVIGRKGHRYWKNQSEAEKALAERLQDKAFVKELVSPSGAEKLLGKKRAAELKSLWDQPPGKPALVPLSDPAPAIVPYGQQFDDLTGEADG